MEFDNILEKINADIKVTKENKNILKKEI